jgi:pyruvate carboxylase subunit B
VESLLLEGLKDYEFDPITTTPDARVVNFPMPGGAIGPNVQMMKEAGILSRYSEVLAEFPVVVKAGGAWTSVTPGSQQYWLQAFNNVLLGRWKKIDPGYGRSVLGYFGRPPLPPDPEVVRIASEQLGKEPFRGDPLEAAPDSLKAAREALEERKLPVTEENVFLVAAAIVPGKSLDLNEGIRFLTGKPRISLPLRAKPEATPTAPAAPAAATPSTSPWRDTVTTDCTVVEGTTTRRFQITIAPPPGATAPVPAANPDGKGTPVYAPFDGKVQLVEVQVQVGDTIREGQVVAAVEAMKAKHDVRAPCAGKVATINAEIGSDVMAGQPILTIAT